MAPALVAVVVVLAAATSAWPPAGGRWALGAAAAAVALAALTLRPVVAEAAYWLTVGALLGWAASALARAACGARRPRREEW